MLLALDAGTTSVRAVAFDEEGRPVCQRAERFPQHFPRPGWVEHDPGEIWAALRRVLRAVASEAPRPFAAVGLTNQRETALAWDRRTGAPLGPAIVWQDRRTATACRRLAEAGHTAALRQATGLVLDPYFSATKWAWMFEEGGIEASPDLVLSTLDSWLAWQLTKGDGSGGDGVRTPAPVVTEPSNACRTLVYDLGQRSWSEPLAELLHLPLGSLPELRPTAGRFGRLGAGLGEGLEGVPLSAMVGDQQAALFGQACLAPGSAKCTYGTGSFVLAQAGGAVPAPADGLLSTVAWDLTGLPGAGAAPFAYALEGSIFATGATVDWLCDQLGLIERPEDLSPLAASVPDSAGAFLIPAFAGLGSPWFDPLARGALVGLSRGVTRAHLARAAVESMAYQVRDVTDAMAERSGVTIEHLRVDGGVSAMDLLLQLQADQLGVPVERAAVRETTARGAALLAGLAEGVYASLEEVAATWHDAGSFTRAISEAGANQRQAAWRRAVDRARGWARPEDEDVRADAGVADDTGVRRVAKDGGIGNA
jgi:glycerol kinase